MGERIEEFRNDLALLKRMSPYAAVDYIRKSIGYDGFLNEYAEYREVKPDDWILLLDDLQETAKEAKTYEDWFVYIEEYGKQLEEKQKEQNEETEGVRLLTMHRAKGLEFDVVFIPDVNEGITPYRKASLPDEIEEERRMFYVGMTRARKHLHLAFPEERYNKRSEPSRFLFEIGGDDRGLGGASYSKGSY
jgi:DNA helicase-2/ATP-dependent DNA helicase PcrA